MKQFQLFLCLILISASASAFEWNQFHLISGCRIFGMNGIEIKRFPGNMCIFLEDGSFLSADGQTLRKFSNDNHLQWELPGHFHHQLNLSSDKKRILTLSSGLVNDDTREDKFLIIDMKGKILFEDNATDIFKWAGITNIKKMFFPLDPAFPVKSNEEISHFNSIYEIGSVTNPAAPKWMKKGNIILNSLHSGIFVLSSDLKKLIHHQDAKLSHFNSTHDVQVTGQGTLIYFNNMNKSDVNPFSTIDEIDPVTNKLLREFRGIPKEIFYSSFMGSVQVLNKDTWLFTHALTGTYIYSPSDNKILRTLNNTHMDGGQLRPTQQVKAENLTLFLKNRKSP